MIQFKTLNRTPRLVYRIAALVICCMCSFCSLGASVDAADLATDNPASVKPNIVLILVDDLGWQDVKCYDVDEPSPIDTPNLDAFAKRSAMFWQAYSPAPTCSPSRCAILSGNHPATGAKDSRCRWPSTLRSFETKPHDVALVQRPHAG